MMFDYDWQNLLAREYFAGVWAVSSLALLIVIGRALVVEMITASPRWWDDYVVQGIAALWLCIAGAWVRAVTRWIELIHVNSDLDAGMWGSWVLLVPAGMLFIGGQILCIYAYAPGRWRWTALWASLAATALIPALVVISHPWPWAAGIAWFL